jgi:hypothetical protein
MHSLVRLIQYVAITAPVFVPAVADAPQTCDRWKPTYPARGKVAVRSVEHNKQPIVPPFIPNVTIQPLTWKPTYPDHIPRTRLVGGAQQSVTSPPFQPPPAFDSGGQIIATGSIRNLIQYQALTAPFHETPSEAPVNAGLLGSYQSRVQPKPYLHASKQQSFAMDAAWAAPAAVTVPELAYVQFTAQVRRAPIRQPWGQPHFAVVTQVPVQSWLGTYPSRLNRHTPRANFAVWTAPLDYDNTINPAAPVLSWQPRYPNQWVRPRVSSAQSAKPVAPLFVPDVTVQTNVLAWLSRYQDRTNRARPNVHHQAWFSDKFTAPTVVAAPDLAVPVYPNRTFGRVPLVPSDYWVAPLHVADVTDPVPALSWLGSYPDRLNRREQAPAYKLTYTGVVFIAEFIPAPDIHEIDGRGSFNRRIWGRGSHHTIIRGRGSL